MTKSYNDMRSVITISLPAESVRDIEAEVKKHKFASTSEFFRHLLREYQKGKLLRELKKDEKNMRRVIGNVLTM